MKITISTGVEIIVPEHLRGQIMNILLAVKEVKAQKEVTKLQRTFQPYTEDEKKQIIEMYQRGVKPKRIGKAMHRTPASISSILYSWGVPAHFRREKVS